MYLDYAIKLNEFIDKLQEPYNFIIAMLVYIILPLLLILSCNIEKLQEM